MNIIRFLFYPAFLVFLPGLGAEPPLIHYTQGGDRALVYVNNPEIITMEDLADPTHGSQAVYRQPLAPGKYRSWAEHRNKAGSRISHGVLLTNPSQSQMTVTINGRSVGTRGDEFRDMFNNYYNTTLTIPAGESKWLITRDDIKNNSFFGHVADFEIQDSAIIYHLQFQDQNSVDPEKLEYQGYIKREYSNHREGRVYKGYNPNTEAILEMHYEINDTTSGTLPVYWKPYIPEDSAFGDSVLKTEGWITNIAIGHNDKATMTDMFSFKDPDWPVPFSPYKKSDALDLVPNFGNWAVVYHHHGSITNTGVNARTVHLRLKGKGLAFAYQNADGVWKQKGLGGEFDWHSFVVPAGQTVEYSGKWVMGGPANGTVTQSVVVEEQPSSSLEGASLKQPSDLGMPKEFDAFNAKGRKENRRKDRKAPYLGDLLWQKNK